MLSVNLLTSVVTTEILESSHLNPEPWISRLIFKKARTPSTESLKNAVHRYDIDNNCLT